MREKATRNSPVPATNGLVSLFLVEGVIIVLLSLATYVLLALLSYSSGDPGWSGTGENAAVVNWVGRSGAWLADVLFFLFGGLAYLLPLLLVIRAAGVYRGRLGPRDVQWDIIGLRGAGIVMTLVSACVLASLHFASDLQASAGGLLGRTLALAALPALELAGATLVSLTLLVLGLTLGLGLFDLGHHNLDLRQIRLRLGVLSLLGILVLLAEPTLSLQHQFFVVEGGQHLAFFDRLPGTVSG